MRSLEVVGQNSCVYLQYNFNFNIIFAERRNRRNKNSLAMRLSHHPTFAMNSLPEEILDEIFSYLDIQSILTVSTVCKRFFNVVNSHKYLKSVSVDLTKWKLYSRGSDRRYVNGFVYSPNEEVLHGLVKTFSGNPSTLLHLKSIRMTNLVVNDPESFLSFASVFFNVTEIKFEAVYVNNLPEIVIKPGDGFRNLTTLSFIYATNKLLSLFTNIKDQLKTVKVCLPGHVTQEDKIKNFESVSRILNNNKTTITKINIYDTNFDDEFMKEIAEIKFTKLKSFSMAFNSCLSKDCRSFESFLVNNYGNLEKFKIRTYDHIGEAQLRVLLANGNNLKKLNLIVCATCDYDQIVYIANLRNLESLKVHSNIYCAYGSKSYERLILDKVLGFQNKKIKNFRAELLHTTPDVMTKIINAFPNLVEINIITACKVQDDSLQMLRDNLKSLKYLRVNNKIMS